MTLSGRRVVLGVSGGIACYKACTVARRLTEAGADVQVILTASASRFVGPVTFEGLTGNPVLTSLWEPGFALDHVRLAAQPDVIVVAPATANLIARAAQGLADDFLSTLLVAATVPVVLAPAMNDDMYAAEPTGRNLDRLRERGWHVVGPATGPLAEGPSNRPGRMEEPEVIVAEAERAMRSPDSPFRGRRVIVTAGPTREPIDAVRVVTNPSSGRMGYAVARAAYARGADVTLITGPSALVPPHGVDLVRVTTTDELHRAVAERLGLADVLVMAAAPSDFRMADPHPGKRPRTEGALTLTFEPTADVLMETVPRRKPGAVMVGFALESVPGPERARDKLDRKQLDLIVLNHANVEGAGFESDTNAVTIISRDDMFEVPTAPKPVIAERVLDAVASRL